MATIEIKKKKTEQFLKNPKVKKNLSFGKILNEILCFFLNVFILLDNVDLISEK